MNSLTPPVIAQHEGTRIYNITSALASVSKFPGNKAKIYNFVSDLLLSRIQAGQSTALLTRKDKAEQGKDAFMSDAVAALVGRMRDHGVPVEFLRPGAAIPADPDPRKVPIITYGMAGIGDYEHYGAVVAVHAFHIDAKDIANAAFDYLPPSRRPKLAFVKGNVRRLDWSRAMDVPATLRQQAEDMYLRMEMDVTCQAVMRVRPSIHPRLVVVNIRRDPTLFLGPMVTVRNLTELRVRLGLFPDTRQGLRAAQADQVADLVRNGATLTSAAETLGVSRRTVTSLRTEFGAGWEVKAGRPVDE